ncbi:hypothetical protein Fmac_010936 [Flemingia macrophylla]|uniref:SHSP domain-containing protein n=1 Tax=Flemingia macrophylla TaxID=520843 RepID=A0ABD1ML05_9FABA
MSILDRFLGRRRSEPSEPHQHHLTPYKPHDLTHPFPFPMDLSPMLNNTSHIECKETAEAHVYKARLPGYSRNDVRVEVDDGRVLCIVCGKSTQKKEHVGPWHRVEHSSGQFMQRLSLPQNAVVDRIEASMDDGVLTVTVPKPNRGVHNRLRNIHISSRP